MLAVETGIAPSVLEKEGWVTIQTMLEYIKRRSQRANRRRR